MRIVTILVSSPCSCHSRDTSSSDSSSGERGGARLISVLFSFRMSLDSSSDDSQVEDDLAGKNKSKLKPCKTTLPANYVPHGTYGYSYPVISIADSSGWPDPLYPLGPPSLTLTQVIAATIATIFPTWRYQSRTERGLSATPVKRSPQQMMLKAMSL